MVLAAAMATRAQASNVRSLARSVPRRLKRSMLESRCSCGRRTLLRVEPLSSPIEAPSSPAPPTCKGEMTDARSGAPLPLLPPPPPRSLLLRSSSTFR
eukprot:CAMPEP_0173175492 /NCGR_PEP_ID=MMETSP1141-20130122/3945_1 /TAXON_ID=483371 /ORGANISM="non described non described, Strain CCMP2298" /LENGTH=97 /DNA_ID=CAMNT_0014097747 /DNA_START=1212 /DNA_END=1501 /DNA_ORIENTATION=+